MLRSAARWLAGASAAIAALSVTTAPRLRAADEVRALLTALHAAVKAARPAAVVTISGAADTAVASVPHLSLLPEF